MNAQWYRKFLKSKFCPLVLHANPSSYQNEDQFYVDNESSHAPHRSIAYTYIIQLTPHWGFSVADYIKCYAYFNLN